MIEGRGFRGGLDEKMRRMWLGRELGVAGLPPLLQPWVKLMDLETPWLVIEDSNKYYIVTINSVCQYNILWYLHHVTGSCLGIPVSGINSAWQDNILWHRHHVPVSCLGIPVSGITSACQDNILWCLHYFPISCLDIPVSGLVFHKKVKQQTYLF